MVQKPSDIALRVRSPRRRDFEHRKPADTKSGVRDMKTAMERVGRFTRAAVWAVVAMAAAMTKSGSACFFMVLSCDVYGSLFLMLRPLKIVLVLLPWAP